jgi:arginase
MHEVSCAVKHNLQANYFLVLSGITPQLGTISGIKAVYPTKRLGVVWIDAHADLHSPYTSYQEIFMECHCQQL